MPTFTDAENVVPFVPEGDYTLTVEALGTGISQGAKTRGCEQYRVEMSVDGHSAYVRETLTDHPACSWKIDTFLKSCGIRLAKGASYELTARKRHAPPSIVNPLGHRCHAKLIVEDWASKDGTKKGKQNKVAVFYTDRPALSPRPLPEPEGDEPF